MVRGSSKRSKGGRCGVYAIQHISSGKCYIGSSNDIANRFTNHRYNLRRGTHKCKALQDLWSKDGEDSFLFKDLEHCSAENLNDREQFYLDRGENILNTSLHHSGRFGRILDESKVRSIRSLANPRVMGNKEIAKKFGISQVTVEKILSRALWSHLI